MAATRWGMMAGMVLVGACAAQTGGDAGAGAGAAAPAPTEAAPAEGQCNAEAVQPLVGRAHSEALAAEALRLSGARTLRVIKPGMAVTMDYRVDRLNLELNDGGTVVAARCG